MDQNEQKKIAAKLCPNLMTQLYLGTGMGIFFKLELKGALRP